MIVDCHLIGFLNLVDTKVTWSDEPLQINSWYGHVSFGNSHLNLQFVNDLVGHIDNFLENIYLLLVACDADLRPL